MRVLNLIEGSGGVDVQINGASAFTNVAFQTITGYQVVLEQVDDFHRHVLRHHDDGRLVLIPAGGEQPYTLLVYGTTSSPLIDAHPEVASAPTNGNVQLSVFNAAKNASNVDIYITAPGVDIATVDPNFYAVG